MSSYTKQMIERAQEWLKANPDPTSLFIKIPGLVKTRDRRSEVEGILKRYDKEALLRPDVKPLVEELRTLTTEAAEVEADAAEREQLLERVLNKTLVPGHGKYEQDTLYGTYVGRWCLAWARHGYNVFDLSADFTAAMLLTDARELDISKVRLPFGGILMIVPDGFARGVEGGHYTKIHITEVSRGDVTGISVANEIGKILEDAQRDGVSPSGVRKILDDLEAKNSGAPPSLISKPAADPDDTAIHIYATDGAHVLDTLIERKGLSWDAFDQLQDSVCCDADKQARQTIRQIVFGALAYISAVESAMEPQPQPKGKHRASSPAAKRWDIGRTIRLHPQLIKAARSGSREVALRLKHRHIVRGHYRNQAYGIRMRERKEIWIAPFWKGPADGAALVHTYVLEDAKDQS